MPTAPVLVSHLFRPLRQGLLQVLHDLTPEEWQRSTVCPGWTVRDIALHLLGVDVSNLSRRRDGFRLEVDSSSPLSLETGLATFLNHFNQEWVEAARCLSPRLMCALLAFVGEQMDDYFAQVDGAAMGGPVSWAGPGPAPVWLDVAREYTERWVHQQQIRDAVNRPGLLEPRYFAPVAATFVHALPYTLRHQEREPGTIARLVVSGDAGGSWVAVRTLDAWVLSSDFPAAAAVTVTVDQDAAWRLFTRGLTPEEARTRVQIDGDRDLGEQMLRMVAIIA